MTDWVTGAAILAQAGAAPGSPDEQAFAEMCAEAVSAGLDARLFGAWGFDVGGVPLPPPTPLPAELTRAALTAGVEAYKARETTYVDQQAAVNRIAADYIETIEPIVSRYATVGIA